MGEVYLAKDKRLERLVAIKILRGDLPHSQWHAQLRSEAQRLAQLNHPNIVQIYDILEQDESLGLVMEYVDGRNLHIQLREQRADLPQLLSWLAQISEALAASHDVGIAHCDLKAENILIGSDGVAKVGDFGIAGSGANFPEDILALGQLAGRMLAAQEKLPPDVEQLLERMTESRPARRPLSRSVASDFHNALLTETQGISPQHTELEPQPARSVFYSVFAAVVVLAIAATAYFFREPASREYVAVLPTVFADSPALAVDQRYNLQATVQQVLRGSVIDTPELALISASETAGVRGKPAVIAGALGADSLLSSTLSCSNTACELTIERLGGPQLAVIAQRTATLIVDSPLQSHDAIRQQWRYLFPGGAPLAGASGVISEQDYRLYIDLYQRDRQRRVTVQDSLLQLEQLLDRADRFMPLYRLYTEVVVEAYEFTGDIALLDRLEEILNRTRGWSDDFLPLQKAWFELALARKNFTDAEKIIADIKVSGGDELVVMELTGSLYHAMAEYELSESYYAKAVALRPSMHLLYGQAKNLYFLAQHDRSLETLDRLLALYPYSTRAHGLKGVIHLELGELEQAIRVYETGLAIRPDPIQRSNLGMAYLLLGDYERAREHFSTAYENDSRDHSLVLNLADSESLVGNSARAQGLYQTLIERSLKDAYAVDLEVLAQSYAQLGQFQEAIATLEEIEAGQDESLDHSFTAALVYSLSGQKILALMEVDSALASGISKVWFDLPWFDPLCSERRFSAMLQESGRTDRCPQE